jgi:hypothetical protein
MRQYRNFGMANQKAIESVAFDENGREIWYSVLTLILQTYPGLEAEERGQEKPLPETYLK